MDVRVGRNQDLQEKYERLKQILRNIGSVVIAFSGGVDSTFLLQAAYDTLGEKNVLAVTAKSAAFPAFELSDAVSFCKSKGIRQMILELQEVEIEGFADNPPDRCYICKKGKFSKFQKIAADQGYQAVCDGTNLSDAGSYRPGMRALQELHIRSPLKEAELTKQDVRGFSQAMGLKTWNKPSYACLASRFPYGEKITLEKLKRVSEAEQFIIKLGLPEMRVRCHGDVLARIEVPEENLGDIFAARRHILKRFQTLGFKYVTLDLEGFRSGSMDEMLQEKL